MSRRGAKRIVADFPVHPIRIDEEWIDAQRLEGKDAVELEQGRQIRREKDVHVEIKAAELVNRQVSEKIVALNRDLEAMVRLPVFGRLAVDEGFNLAVVKEHVLELRVQQPDIRDSRLRQHGQVRALARLNNAVGNRWRHSESLLRPASFAQPDGGGFEAVGGCNVQGRLIRHGETTEICKRSGDFLQSEVFDYKRA